MYRNNIRKNNHLVHITLVLDTIRTRESWYDFMDSKVHKSRNKSMVIDDVTCS